MTQTEQRPALLGVDGEPLPATMWHVARRPRWIALLGLALFSTAFAYSVYFRLISSAGPANAILVTFVIPVAALLLGNLLLGEPITLRAVMGMAVILTGLALLDARWQKRANPA